MTSNLPAVILIAFLVSCHPAPAIADGMSAFVSIPPIAARYQNHVLHRKEFLASAPVALYSGDAHPHGETGWQTRYTERTTAHSGFFVRVRSCSRYGGLDEGHLRMRRFSVPVCQPLFSPPPDAWQLQVVVNPYITEASTMTTPAQNSPAVRHRSAVIAATILLSLSSSRRVGTAEIQQRLASEGIPVSLRTVQRHLTDLSAVLPIEGDGNSPQGWRWASGAVSLVSLSGGAA